MVSTLRVSSGLKVGMGGVYTNRGGGELGFGISKVGNESILIQNFVKWNLWV